MRALLFPQITHMKKRKFLLAYAACGLLTQAAREAEIDRRLHTYWRHHDPDYEAAFALAQTMAADAVEDEATRRALGWDEARIAEDGTPYTIRKYSDTLLIVRLKALKPDLYRDTAKRDERTDVSELLKAVLLELAERSHARDVTPEAEWAPVPPGPRPSLPPPPDAAEA